MKAVILEKTNEIYKSDHVKCVTIPSESGEICVYPDHIAIVALMITGNIRITYIENGIDKYKDIEINEGIFSFKDNLAIFLIELKA